MSRAAARADKANARRFEKQIAGNPLDTALIEVGTSLAGHKHERIFADAALDACRSAGGMRCIVCTKTFSTMRPIAATLLTCSSVKPRIASASGVCLTCWRPNDFTKIEIAATRVLQKIIRGGRFIDPPPLPLHDTS